MRTVVDHILTTRFEDLDTRTIEAVKLVVLDTMGAAVAGSRGEGIDNLASLIRGWGGKPEADVLVYGDRVPAFQAALLNGAMARAWDIDDAHETGGGHLGASLVPTALILAQCAPTRISGRQLILAIALATDLACRLRLAMAAQNSFGWVLETFIPFGVVAMGGRLLGLDRDTVMAGMGLAYSQSSCNSQGVVDGALSVRLQQGLAAKAGILALEFARIGFTGARNVLQGTYGLYPLYGRNSFNPRILTGDLGKHFEIVNTSIKQYPSCKHTHIAMSAIAQWTRDMAIVPSEIERITVRTNQAGYDKCASSPTKRRPISVVDAQFSIPIMVALAAVNRRVISLDDLDSRAWENELVYRIADKVEVKVDPELDRTSWQVVPNVIELVASNGRERTQRFDRLKGSPDDPLSFAECEEKFEQCVAFAARQLDSGRTTQFRKMTADLEMLDDVRPMARLLCNTDALR